MLTQDVWKEFHDVVQGFVRKRVNDPQDVKDIVQDIFLKIHLNLESLRDNQKLSSWVHQIVRHTISDYYRKRNMTGSVNFTHLSINEDNLYLIKHLVEFILPFVGQLGDRDREAIYATDIKGMSQKEFAQKKWHNIFSRKIAHSTSSRKA